MTTIRRAAPACGFFCLLLSACGGAADVDATHATLEPVRGTTTLADAAAAPVARVGNGQRIVVPATGVARLSLDDGPRVLLGGGTRAMLLGGPADGARGVAAPGGDGSLRLDGGRAYVDVHAGDTLSIVTPSATVRTNDGAVSVECTDASCSALRAYVVRGEASWVTASHHGRVRAGEALTIAASGSATTAPEMLWADWTGGLARPGPTTGQAARGVGTLEGRVPGEEGLARWPLVVRRLDVRVAVHDDLAITEVDETFFNPASDTVEGLYRFHTPEGAVLQRFAVDRNGTLVDGYVREKEQAAQAYQAQVYVGSTDDPALLEWSAPGSFQARIYPIQPGATRRIVVRYAEWLSRPAEGAPRLYRYPMAAEGDSRQLPIDELSIDADLSDAGRDLHVRAGLGATVEEGRVTLRQSSVVPRADFWMEIEGGDEQSLHAYRADHQPPQRAPGSRAVVNEADERDYWFLPVVLPERLAGDEAARADHGMDLVIVADVSAATDASHLELGRSVAESLVAHLGEHDRVAIVTSDLSLHALGGETQPQLGPVAPERISRLLDDLARQPSGGATDLGAAIGEAAALLDPARSGAVVYIGDGAPTVGELGADGLLTVMSRLPQPVRLYAVAVGDNANLDLLETLSRGGGLAQRVVDRAGGAEAAMRILAHAARPLAQRVTVDLGTGIDNAFPRRPVDVVIGDVLPVVGRVRDDVPAQITVHGVVHGRPFTETLAVTTKKSDDATDLRLRWAGERLRQLLIDGAGREAIAELGTRYGLITPYTSYYVPSARELAQMGQSAANFEFHPLPASRVASGEQSMPAWALVALGPLALTGCTRSDAPAKPGTESSSLPGWLDPTSQSAPARDQTATEGENARRAVGDEGQMGQQRERNTANRYAVEAATGTTPTTTDTPVAMPVMPAGTVAAEQPPMAAPPAAPQPNAPSAITPSPYGNDTAAGADGTTALGALQGGQVGGNFGFGGLGLRGSGGGGGTGTGEGTIGLGNVGTIGHGGGGGDGSGYGRGEPPMRIHDGDDARGPVAHHAASAHTRPDEDHEVAMDNADRGTATQEAEHSGILGALAGGEANGDTFRTPDILDRLAVASGIAVPDTGGRPSGGGQQGTWATTTVTTSITVTTSAVPHVVKRCSDAASLSLDDRRALWRERLSRVGGDVSAIADVYRAAVRDCELDGWADRRALLDLALDAAGGVSSMVSLYRVLDDGSARGYLRAAILRRVHTPADLRTVRDAFGLDQGVDWTLVEQVLARQTTPEARIRTLRQLLLQYPGSFDLKLRLLSELEGQHRLPEAKRLAEDMRGDPLADAGVRTAIGEMYVRLGDEGEAKRVFSEIVEMAPLDELARRRLGDLYRAHGWFDDAYRQYQTLAQIRPDDPTVSLLLAQAAAGAGRVDEALRLEQRIVETAEPGAADGLARTALLWSSVRFAQLRKAARDEHDQAKLDALTSRMRRSGVLRAAGALRVSLTWSHPDAQLSLWASYPGLPLARPTDIAPELGIEALDVQDDEAGTYEIEVRRTTQDTRTAVDAQLLVIWHEGQADEQISIVPLHFGEGQRTFAWTITGRSLATAVPSGSESPTHPGGPQ